MIERDFVLRTIRLLLERDPVSENTIRYWMSKSSHEAMVAEIVSGKEYHAKIVASISSSQLVKKISSVDYFRPPELQRDLPKNKKVLLIGSCLIEPWSKALERTLPSCSADHILVNNMSGIPDLTTEQINSYSFQVLQIPMRFVFDDEFVARTQYMSTGDRDDFSGNLKAKVEFFLTSLLKYNRTSGIETYVINFVRPQSGLLGRLFPKYDKSNLGWIYEEMNRYLSGIVAREKNCYLFDLDSLSSAFGKRFVFDDVVAITGHGGYLSDYDAGKDQNRIEAPVRLSMQQEFKTWEFMDVIWAELFAMHGTLAREDSVKLLVTDLDDTLWRGVIGEGDFHDGGIEGWPLGYMEALLVLKQRGILLGIISKNTKEIVEEKWNIATGGRIKLSDFAVTRINWKPKVENMASILADVNLLPKNVVYVDDNPVERHAMADAFPGIRVLGDNPYSLKRILLWSAETQVPVITPEGAKRTEMVQAQVRRNEDMGTMSRDVFLKSLELKVDVNIVPAQADRRFQRSFELINKTNQFNTTGKRWSLVEIGEVLERGGFMVTFDIVDRYTNYGLVGVLIVQGDEILQYVMSCRVIGLDVETTVLRALAHRLMIADRGQVVARVIETPANIVCRDVFSRAGFEAADGRWVLRKDPGGAPPHIALAWGEGVVPAPAVDAMNRLHNMAL